MQYVQPVLRKFTAIALVILSCPGAWGRTRAHRPRVLRMVATAYAQNFKTTADGTVAHRGIAAADPAVLPLNSRISVRGAGPYSGIYNVRDTGNKIVGRRIDLCLPSRAAAKQFGKKPVTVRVLKVGDNQPVNTAPAAVVK